MWFSVVCTVINNNVRHHSGQNVVDLRGTAEWVRNKFWPLGWRVSLSIKLYTTLNHIRFVFYHNINGKENVFFFSERDQDRDIKKEQALSITLFSKMSVSDWLLQQAKAITRILNRATRMKVERWTSENTTSTVQLLQIFKQNFMMTAAKRTHWHLQWCSPWKKPFGKAKALEFVAEYEIELEAGVTLASSRWTTAELSFLLTRAFERMLEQCFNCFTCGLEL